MPEQIKAQCLMASLHYARGEIANGNQYARIALHLFGIEARQRHESPERARRFERYSAA